MKKVIGSFLIALPFMAYGLIIYRAYSDTNLDRCKKLYKGYGLEDSEDIKEVLRLENKTFDERLTEMCERFVKNGQEF